jgi:hypothetical protein
METVVQIKRVRDPAAIFTFNRLLTVPLDSLFTSFDYTTLVFLVFVVLFHWMKAMDEIHFFCLCWFARGAFFGGGIWRFSSMPAPGIGLHSNG